MRRTAFCLCLLLVGCVAETSPPAQRSAQAEIVASQTTDSATIGQHSFRVTITEDRRQAFVAVPSTRGTFTGADIEAAAAEVSGCAATIHGGEWAFLGDLQSFDLSNLRPEFRTPVPAWRVDLTC